jgi:ribosome-interacting GTPase 1
LAGIDLVVELLAQKAVVLYPAGGGAPADTRPGWLHMPALLVATGMDREGAEQDLAALGELLETPWPTVAVSCLEGTGFDELGRRTFQALDIIRVYTKEPKKDADLERPFTLQRGATVGDLARTIHKDIAEGLKFARVWGASAFDGQSVKAAHVLAEGDVVEIHW